MDYSTIANNKTTTRNELKSKYSFPKRPKIIVAIHLSSAEQTNFVADGLSCLPVNFIVVWSKFTDVDQKNVAYINDFSEIDTDGVDAIICDNESGKIEDFMKQWIVPIICEKNYLGKILTEFSAARGEWNAYIYDSDSNWSIYYALIRYLENLKFPYDNRNLVKNVLWL